MGACSLLACLFACDHQSGSAQQAMLHLFLALTFLSDFSSDFPFVYVYIKVKE